MSPRIEPGYRTFLIVWFGQLVSQVGSSISRFALGLWVFQRTGSTTQLALVILAARVPALLISPLAGALVDRWQRRRAMILSDAGAAAGTLTVAALLATGSLQIWHLYVVLGIASAFGAFQQPAYTAATTLLVPKRHYARAAGLVQLAGSAGTVLGPIAGAAILVVGGLTTAFVTDLATFAVAVLTLSAVRFPELEEPRRPQRGFRVLLAEARVGLDYVTRRRGLVGLLVAFSAVNVAISFHSVLIFPLLLGFATETTAGATISFGALGMVAGSAFMSAWGGPRRRVEGLLAALTTAGIGLAVAGLRPSPLGVATGIFITLFSIPIAAGISQAIWQSKIPPELQGRVFSLRLMMALGATPLAYLLAGPLADHLFEPLLATGGALAGTVGRLIGTGPGRGIGAFFIALGACIVVVAATALGNARIRNLDREIPDVVEDQPREAAATR
jgi:DHA3 family macrolide efflux protein-like MFS transporter